MEKQNKMGVMPVPKLVITMALPLMLSLLVQSLYNIVDGIFVGRISEEAFAATSLAYPVQLMLAPAWASTPLYPGWWGPSGMRRQTGRPPRG